MLLLLYKILHHFFGCKIPVAFLHFSTRILLAAVTSLLISVLLGSWFIRKLYVLKIGQSIRSSQECSFLAELHGKKKDTPTMGGVLILFSMVVSLVLWMDLTNVFTYILLGATLFLGVLGGTDDYLKLRDKNSRGLSPRKKMICQVLFSGMLALYLLTPALAGVHGTIAKQQVWSESSPCLGEGHHVSHRTLKALSIDEYMERLYLPFFKDPIVILDGFWKVCSFLFIIVVITGSSNAVNLTDGLDGLAAGCLILVSFVLGVIAFLSNNIDLARYLNILYIEGSGEIAIYLFALCGACLGFLWYNGHPAQVFMGDTGSLALGGILGVASILLRREVLLALSGAVFVIEALSVIIQVLSYRLRNKKRVFLCAPLHHHFEYKGWPETKVVLRFWMISILFALLSIVSIKFQ